MVLLLLLSKEEEEEEEAGRGGLKEGEAAEEEEGLGRGWPPADHRRGTWGECLDRRGGEGGGGGDRKLSSRIFLRLRRRALTIRNDSSNSCSCSRSFSCLLRTSRFLLRRLDDFAGAVEGRAR